MTFEALKVNADPLTVLTLAEISSVYEEVAVLIFLFTNSSE